MTKTFKEACSIYFIKILMVKIAKTKLKTKPNNKSIESEMVSFEMISIIFKVIAANMTGIDSKSENFDELTLL